jgi:hypothetical protein
VGIIKEKVLSDISVTPKNSILVEGFTLFSTDSSNPQSFDKFSKVSKAS